MALRHALATACLVLTFAALPSSAASGDIVRAATYAVGVSVDAVEPAEVVVACVETETPSQPDTNLNFGVCQFTRLGAGTYVVRVRDDVLGAIPFSYVGVHYDSPSGGLAEFCSPPVEDVVDATVTVTDDCEGISLWLEPAVAATGTITIEVA